MGPWLSVYSIPASFNNSFPLCLRSLAQCFHAFFFASQSYYLHLWVSEEPKIFSHHLQYIITSKHGKISVWKGQTRKSIFDDDVDDEIFKAFAILCWGPLFWNCSTISNWVTPALSQPVWNWHFFSIFSKRSKEMMNIRKICVVLTLCVSLTTFTDCTMATYK